MYKSIASLVFSVGLFSSFCVEAEDCLDESSLRSLDKGYEYALRVGDLVYLQQLLAPEFVWVHNLAVQSETKADLLKRLSEPSEVPKARTTSNLTFHRLENTVVVSGLSSVEKYNEGGKTTRIARYQFMRTYVKQSLKENTNANSSQCLLLAVQTMKVFSSDSPP